jgi:type IV secretory pathway TraG/TraD family ATPase VirD4
MSTATPLPKAANPLEPLESLAGWLTHAIALVAIGVLFAIVAARLLRSRGLHWSWAAGAVLVAGLLHSPLASVEPALLTAAVCTMMRARRSHREDLEAGADLADAAARRCRPIDLLRGGFGALVLGHRRAAAGGWFRAGEMVVGRDERGRLVSIPFGGTHGGTHTLLVGATGSGKTVTQTWMAVRAIEHGMGAIVIDPKGDGDMRAAVAHAAEAAGRSFIEWTPHGPSVYNPFAHGSETEIADKVLAGERFTEPHYLRQAQRLLGHVVRSLRAAGVEVDLHTIAQHLDPMHLEMLVRALPADQARSTEAYLDSLSARQLSEITGVRDRLAILAESDVGPWLDPSATERSPFDLLEAVRCRDVVYFELDADSRPLLTQMLGAAIVGDLQTTVAALQGRPTPTIVVIDEFSALAAEHVVRLFGRARSAGLSLVLSTQELSDLRLHGREALLEQVMGNLTVVLSHRQVVPGSAELIASLAGKRGAWRTSRNGAGHVSRTRVREEALSAETVMALGLGCVAAIVLSDGREARLAHVLSLDDAR